MEQQRFLQSWLMVVEQENFPPGGYQWWWIGLNDAEEADKFVWPVNGPANFTWWDVDYGEPYEGALQANPLKITSINISRS